MARPLTCVPFALLQQHVLDLAYHGDYEKFRKSVEASMEKLGGDTGDARSVFIAVGGAGLCFFGLCHRLQA